MRVFSVTPCTTKNPAVTQYLIHVVKVATPSYSIQLQTLNAWAATLCQRAKDQSKSIAVTWEQTAYGPTLKQAHFVKVEGAA